MNRETIKNTFLENLTIPENELLAHLNQSSCTTAKTFDEWLDQAKVYRIPSSLYLPKHFYQDNSEIMSQMSFENKVAKSKKSEFDDLSPEMTGSFRGSVLSQESKISQKSITSQNSNRDSPKNLQKPPNLPEIRQNPSTNQIPSSSPTPSMNTSIYRAFFNNATKMVKNYQK